MSVTPGSADCENQQVGTPNRVSGTHKLNPEATRSSLSSLERNVRGWCRPSSLLPRDRKRPPSPQIERHDPLGFVDEAKTGQSLNEQVKGDSRLEPGQGSSGTEVGTETETEVTLRVVDVAVESEVFCIVEDRGVPVRGAVAQHYLRLRGDGHCMEDHLARRSPKQP